MRVDSLLTGGRRKLTAALIASVVGLVVMASPALAADTTPPSAPPNVRAAGATPTTITLAWDTSTDDVAVASYEVYADFTLQATIPQSGPHSFTDTGLSPDSLHNYFVFARDTSGNLSARSTSINLRTQADTTPPTAPVGLSGQYSGPSNTVTLSWTAAADDVAVTRYEVYRNQSKIAESTTTSYADATVTANTGYSYVVKAVDQSLNFSAQSNTFTITTDGAPPTAPGSLRVTGVGTGSVSLAWNAATDNFSVKSYEIWRNGVKVATRATMYGTTYYNSGLASGTSYTYHLTATDPTGNVSAPSNSVVGTTTGGAAADTQAPTVPANVHVTDVTTGSVALSWSASTDNVGVAGYDVLRNGAVVGSTTGTTYTDAGLAAATTYSFTVKARDASGNLSAVSGAVNGTTSTAPDTQAPSVPADVQVTGVTTGSVALSWSASTDNVGVAGYDVLRNGAVVGSASGTTYTSSGLAAGTTYSFTVKARDAAGNVSAASSAVNGTTSAAPDTQAPSVPSNVQVTGVTTGSVALAWSASTDNVGVAGYDVLRNGAVVGSTTGTTYSDSGLAAGTTYSYTVKASDAAGNISAGSSAVTGTTSSSPPPTPASTWPGGFVSGMTPLSATNGLGPVELDRSNGGAAAGDGTTLTLNGTTYSKGLGAHAPSSVRYDLMGRCSTFSASIGVDDAVGSAGSVVFQLWADGVKVYDSGTRTGSSSTSSFSKSITGKQVLDLVVTDAGNGTAGDSADWANAKLTCANHLADLPLLSVTNGLGPVELDRSNGGAAAGDGTALKLNGTTYTRGLGTFAGSSVSVALDGRCNTFSASVGIDDAVGSAGSAVFQVWGDGVKIYDSGTRTGSSSTLNISRSVVGRQTLTLVVTDAGNGNASDSADWANARLTCG